MTDERTRKKNKGNYSYVIIQLDDGNNRFHVIKYVKTRGKDCGAGTKKQVVFDKLFRPEDAQLVDGGVLKEVINDMVRSEIGNES